MTMIERVAKAIADANGQDVNTYPLLYSALARAAIEAMDEYAGTIAPEYAYEAAINAALKEQEE